MMTTSRYLNYVGLMNRLLEAIVALFVLPSLLSSGASASPPSGSSSSDTRTGAFKLTVLEHLADTILKEPFQTVKASDDSFEFIVPKTWRIKGKGDCSGSQDSCVTVVTLVPAIGVTTLCEPKKKLNEISLENYDASFRKELMPVGGTSDEARSQREINGRRALVTNYVDNSDGEDSKEILMNLESKSYFCTLTVTADPEAYEPFKEVIEKILGSYKIKE